MSYPSPPSRAPSSGSVLGPDAPFYSGRFDAGESDFVAKVPDGAKRDRRSAWEAGGVGVEHQARTQLVFVIRSPSRHRTASR
jgi:hypothetical protein